MGEFQLNKNLAKASQSPIRAFDDQISNIPDLIRLTIGEPDFDTPDFIKEAAIQAIQATDNGYSHSRGLIALRKAIQSFLKRHFGLDYSIDQEIIVTNGATEGIFACLMACLNPGDQVLVPSPYYGAYKTQISVVGGELIPIDLSKQSMKLTPDLLESAVKTHPKARLLIFNHPVNPTGQAYSVQEVQALAQVIKTHQLLVIADEIYSFLNFDQDPVSLAQFIPNQTLLVNGASKSHSMTGWRMGFVCGPQALIQEVFKVHQACVTAASTQSQYAALAAYTQGDQVIASMRQSYQTRRDYLVAALTEAGYEVSSPRGAFYLFIKVPASYQGDDYQFCLDLAHQAGVGLIPGSCFGQAGKGYCRLSYAASMDLLQQAVQRMTAFKKTE